MDYMRQKLFPALNETTGFLAVSFVVIMCLANVIMKTAPKYMVSVDKEIEEKTTGFVAWLQTSGLSWLPIVIPVVIVSVITIIPMENKLVKIGLIGGTLLGAFMMALFFNVLKKLFSPKEEAFINIKEEFGHTDAKLLEEKAADPNKPDAGKHPLDLSIAQDLGIKITTGDHITEAKVGQFVKNINVGHWNDTITLTGEHNNTHDIFYSRNPHGTVIVDGFKKLPVPDSTTKVPHTIPLGDVKDNAWYFHRIPKNVYVFENFKGEKDAINNSSYCIQEGDTGLWKISDPKPSFKDYYELKDKDNFGKKNTIKKLSVITNLKDKDGNSKGYKILFLNDNYFTATANKTQEQSAKTSSILEKKDYNKAVFIGQVLYFFKKAEFPDGFVPPNIFDGTRYTGFNDNADPGTSSPKQNTYNVGRTNWDGIPDEIKNNGLQIKEAISSTKLSNLRNYLRHVQSYIGPARTTGTTMGNNFCLNLEIMYTLLDEFRKEYTTAAIPVDTITSDQWNTIKTSDSLLKYNEFVKICSEMDLSDTTVTVQLTGTELASDLYYTIGMYNDAAGKQNVKDGTQHRTIAYEDLKQPSNNPKRLKVKTKQVPSGDTTTTDLDLNNDGNCQLVEYDNETSLPATYFIHIVPKGTKIFTYDQEPRLHEDTWYELNATTGLYDLYDYQDVPDKFADGFPITKNTAAAGQPAVYAQERPDITKLKEDDPICLWGDYQHQGFKNKTDLTGEPYKKNGNHRTLTVSTAPSDIILSTVDNKRVLNLGSMILIKDQKFYFKAQLEAMKSSFGASYTIYYFTVWASILGYIIVTGFQGGDRRKGLEKMKKLVLRLLPFLIVNALETMMVNHSHQTFIKKSASEKNIDDVNKISSMYTYAVGAYATRIATVVAFFSYILTHAKDG